MELLNILKETYKSFYVEDQKIFDLSFPVFIETITSKEYEKILNDPFTLKYIYENIDKLLNVKDFYKIKLLNNELFLKLIKNRDILKILLSLEKDEDKIDLLLNDIISSRIFNNHFLIFDILNLNFKSEESYINLLNKVSSKAKIIILKGIVNEDFVVKLLKQINIEKEMDLMMLLRRFKKDENKLLFLNKLSNPQYISQIIISLNDKKYIKDNFDILTNSYKLAYLRTLSDSEKIYYIENTYYNLDLIASLDNIDLLFKYFVRLKLYEEQKIVIEKVRDDEIKYSLFKLMRLSYDEYIEMVMLLIKTINDKHIKLELISVLKNEGINNAIKTNEEYVDFSNEEVEAYPNVDETITIGLELECSHELNKSYIALGSLLKSWSFKEEGTVGNGIEITSRILNYNENDLKEIKFVCNFLKENGFTITKDCGGHIHLGFDYIKSITHLQLIYYIYIHCEEIFALMFNKENTLLRDGAKANARFIKNDILNMYGRYIQTNADTLKGFSYLLGIAQKDRFASLNILNAFSGNKNTLEIRIPNGTIDFDDLHLNIILFTRLLQKAKYFSENVSDKKLLKKLLILSEDIPIEDKKNYLLDILFEEDYELKNIFYDRFEANYNLIKSRSLTKK